MNAVDKLLKLDSRIEKNTGVIELYLSRVDETLEFPIQEVDSEYVAELQEDSIELNIDSNDVKIRSYNQKVFTIIEGCPVIFKNDAIMKHFSCQTPKDLVKRLLTSGDMDDLFNEIQELNGYKNKKENKEDIKN